MHTDSLNADVPNLIAPLSSFSGGELFVQHPEGSERQHFQGKELQGFLLDCSQRPWLFDAKRSQHCTLPWEGTRTVLVAFSVALSFKPQDAQVAAALGFNLPSEPTRIPRPSSLDLRDLRHGGDEPVLAPTDSTPDAKRARAALDDAQAFALQHQFHLPPEGPLFLELCAGSAQLSACAARRGFMPVAVDCSENRHQTKYKTFNLDLGSPGSWSTLRHLVSSHLERIAHVHISPPCGTCSRARGLPLPDGSPGPPPLRDAAHVWGLPGLQPSQQTRVDKANTLYLHMCDFIAFLQGCGVPWTIENPSRSWLWKLPILEPLVEAQHMFHCETCAFGSQRLKRTAFLASHREFQLVARLCPGCPVHLPWGVTPQGDFATGREATFPIALCETICDAVELLCTARGCLPGSPKTLVARAQKQPRGRATPQLIPEFLRIESAVLPQVPVADSKKRLLHAVAGVPAGSKLLRCADRGSKGWLCVLGVYRSPLAFATLSKQLLHPYDTLVQLPDCLLKVIFKQLTLSPHELAAARLRKLQTWRSWAGELQEQEKSLKASMHPDVADILKPKRICLMKKIAQEMSWPDMCIFDEMTSGFRLVGDGSKSGLFRPGAKLASLSEDDLLDASESLRPQLLQKVMRERPDADSEELRNMTEKEASEKKWLQGPFSHDEISSRFGRWLPVRRFGVRQNDKLRAIDDFRENQLNRAYSSVEKVVLHAMDHLLWSLQTLLRYLIERGEVSLELSTGEVLRGQVHPSWSLRKDSLVVTALDLRSAYKQLPLSPLDQDKTVVVLRDHRSATSKVDCYVMKTLPFGSSASVDKFLRVSAFIQAAGCELLLLWSNYFDDFPLASHHLTSTSSLAAAKAMLSLFGFEYAGDKLPPFRPWCEVLGIKLDLTAAHEGEIRISNKPSRVVEVQRLLDRALDSRSLTPAAVPSFIGKLQYADSQVWGRSGRIALGDLRSLGGSGSSAVTLDPDQMAALAVLRDRFAKGQPITLLASRPSLPGVLFTDGALEGGRASIGGVFYPSCRDMPAEVFGCPLPDAVLEDLKGDKEHVIGAVELYAVATAVTLWMPRMAGQRVLVFNDNWPALDTLVRGTSGIREWRKVLLAMEKAEADKPPVYWFARVPSGSNDSDDPSRGSLKALNNENYLIVQPSCPLTGCRLPSYFETSA